MINTIKTLKITKKLPESTLQAMRNLNVNRIFKDKSFTSYFEDSIVQSSEYSEKEKEKMESFMTFWYNLIAIGCFLGVPENTDEVQDTVKAVYMNMVEIFMKEYDDFNQKISENEIIDFFSEWIQEIVNISEIQQIINSQCGDGATDYIVQAVLVFGNKRNND